MVDDTLARHDYPHLLRRGWLVLLVFVVLGGAVGWGLTLAGSKLYRANIQLFVATSSSQSALGLAHGNPFVPDRVQSYISIATSPAVTGPVIHRLGLSLTEPELAAKISADAPQNKVLINLHVTDHNPRAATRIANAVAAQFATVVENTEKADAHGKSIVRVSVIHPAIVPSSPISPDATLKIGLGGLVGLLLGAGVVIARPVNGPGRAAYRRPFEFAT